MLDQSAAGEKMTVRIGRTTLGFRLQGRNDTDQENGRTIQKAHGFAIWELGLIDAATALHQQTLLEGIARSSRWADWVATLGNALGQRPVWGKSRLEMDEDWFDQGWRGRNLKDMTPSARALVFKVRRARTVGS